ncbi:adenylate/guanylate cyclase domain-containing protein [Mycobacterium sp. NPDC050551]|uniref:adenylate/guanylate cyclase domain-containing protein n=1 Tax=Mycobacterium sp. NPDC050551 TaxID=3155407 RepID=UPI00341A1AA9
MPVVCMKCGAAPRDGARFCDACGTPISQSVRPPEFKQVTVLFADVVRSMEIASMLGTERLREVMADLLMRCRTVVTRYGGTVDFTGDGIMAIFGAPIALEDHAHRGCLAAFELQEQARLLAVEVLRRDGVPLQLRVGLNSGEVIAGEMGPGSYTAIGAHVGMAQRMESVAAPGGVMLSATTARLVESLVGMGDLEMVRIKNVEDAVPARRLVSVRSSKRRIRRHSTLVGRDHDVESLCVHLDATLRGDGEVVGVVGAPGIGKSRLVAEVVDLGAERGVSAFCAFCEAHAREVPFFAAGRLFREVIGVAESQGEQARDKVRAQFPGADSEDLLLVDDLLSIGAPDIDLPMVSSDARRRRLTAVLGTASSTRCAPVMYVIEDAHWIDDASEALIADFLSQACRTPALGLVTYRPEYRGRLARQAVHTIAPAALDHRQSTALIAELLGDHPSMTAICAEVAHRAGGNPFFVEEMVRDLAERGVLEGGPGAYVWRGGGAHTHVPATLQATIAARIDRLGGDAKRTLNAAAVIGARFTEAQLACVVDQIRIAELLDAELIDEVVPAPPAEYGFRHPLIRSVAYESQLHVARAELHRRLASALQQGEPGLLDENAALIAMHVEAAGDLRAAFGWHIRAGTWLSPRDMTAARASWERARQVAERLPADDTERVRMSVEAATLLCGSAWRAGIDAAETGYDELRRLCAQIGDDRSAAVGMSGMVMALAFCNRPREASVLGTELSVLLEDIGDSELTTALLFSALAAKWETGEVLELARLAQTVIDAAGRDPTRGNLFFGSPLVLSTALRGVAHMCLGRAGWKDDLDDAIAAAQTLDPLTRVVVSLHKYAQIGLGAVRADASALRATAESLSLAERSGEDFLVSHALLARGITLVAAGAGDEREFGWEHLRRARQAAVDGHANASLMQIADIHLAMRLAELGDIDGAIGLSAGVIEELFDSGAMLWRGPATTVLVEALLERREVRAARAAMDRLASVATDAGFILYEVPLLRLRALAARAEGDESGCRRLTARYREVAVASGFEGHTDVAATMV